VQTIVIDNLEVRGLPPRQAETLALIAKGLSAKTVARLMGISSRTVEMNLNHTMLRLHARNRVHLVIQAVATGMLKVQSSALTVLMCLLILHVSLPADDGDHSNFVRHGRGHHSRTGTRGRRGDDNPFDDLELPPPSDEDETV
jgi:DNA-binding CsgD family transcriptional regulator